ncbi:HET-C-related protein [Pseudomonas alloputida]|uniref:HET-C-related protein n=1 Tax=Pseudomonas TaxID=286 RepID=UPI003EEAD0D9
MINHLEQVKQQAAVSTGNTAPCTTDRRLPMLFVHPDKVYMMNDQHPDITSFASDIALNRLAEIAASIDAQLFTHLFRPIFGSRLTPALFVHLHRELIAKALSNPTCQVSSDINVPCTYSIDTGQILVQHGAIAQAIEDPATTAMLLVSLMGAFALYIQHLLLQGHKALDAPSITPPDTEDMTSAFVQTLLFYTKPIPTGSTIATFIETGIEHTLPLRVPELPPRRTKRFAAGRGHGNSHTSFGHESIEDALEVAGFDEAQRKAIYFGNWLRDYSQLIDPKIVLPSDNGSTDTAAIIEAIVSGNLPRVSREKLTAIFDLFGLKEFHALQQTPEGREAYRVTPKLLGVYRAHEHVDNPTTMDREAFDPRSIDPDFTALVFPDDIRNKVLPKRSMKRYVRRPIAYMNRKLEAAKKEGMTADGLRLFGEALHVLEDYFAHSNFIELSLRKLGYGEVLTWTSRIESREESRHEWPIITGKFGALDIVGSVSDPLANLLFGDDGSPPPGPGERSDFDQVMLILLKDEEPLLLRAYELYLSARDSIKSSTYYQWFEKVSGAVEAPVKVIEQASNLIRRPLLKWAGDHIASLQSHLDGDPNEDASIMATHSQLAKDHDTHPLHTLAVRLAAQAVSDVGHAMFNHWMAMGAERGDPRAVAEAFIVHPNDTNWYTQIVDEWASANPERVEQAKSIETLRQIQSDDLDNALKAIRGALDKAVEHIEEIEEITGTDYWEIVNLPDAGPAPWSL